MTMNKINLIKLGAIAQKQFDMKDNFQIMEVASDHLGKVRVAVEPPANFSIYAPLDYDEVELVCFGAASNYESVWCGYAPRANVLVIKQGK